MADATTEIMQRFIEMHEFVAFSVVDAGQLIAWAVARYARGNVGQTPRSQHPSPATELRK